VTPGTDGRTSWDCRRREWPRTPPVRGFSGTRPASSPSCWGHTRRVHARPRQALQSLDALLREAAGADPRPYVLASEKGSGSWELSSDGGPLTPAQEADARRYISFLRGGTP